jgi:hypothetical protein
VAQRLKERWRITPKPPTPVPGGIEAKEEERSMQSNTLRKLLTVAFAVALMTSALAMPAPRASAAGLCGYSYAYEYFSNSTYTVQVGECMETCQGQYHCTGEMTKYVKYVTGRCIIC